MTRQHKLTRWLLLGCFLLLAIHAPLGNITPTSTLSLSLFPLAHSLFSLTLSLFSLTHRHGLDKQTPTPIHHTITLKAEKNQISSCRESGSPYNGTCDTTTCGTAMVEISSLQNYKVQDTEEVGQSLSNNIKLVQKPHPIFSLQATPLIQSARHTSIFRG